MIFVILPAYNEEQNLGSLLQRICWTRDTLPVPLRIVLVDDGSRDRTVDVAQSYRDRLDIDVVCHGENRGLAASLKTGLARALETAHGVDDLVITMDADDTHLPGLISRMLERSREGYDIVIASRFVDGARMRGLPLPRRVFSLGASLLCRLLAPMEGVRDYTCGYRGYQAAFLHRMWEEYGDSITTESGFSCMADILLKCRIFNPVVLELPLILRYDRKGGASKMPVLKTITDTLRLLGRAAMLSLEARLGIRDRRFDQGLQTAPASRSRSSPDSVTRWQQGGYTLESERWRSRAVSLEEGRLRAPSERAASCQVASVASGIEPGAGILDADLRGRL